MAKTKLVALTGHVPTWVRAAFIRCAKEQRRTVSSLVAEILIEDCADDPENPKNQPPVGTVATPPRKAVPAAPTGPQPAIDPRERHKVRPISEMPPDEDVA
jgi:hypothetical protein